MVVAPAAVSPTAPPPPPPPSTVSEPQAKDLEQPSKNSSAVTSRPDTIEEVPETETVPSSAHQHEHGEQSTTAQETTKKPTFDDLLESAKRRKRRSAGPLPSPLASNPPSPIEGGGDTQEVPAHTLQKAFDDFELDVRKSIGRASLLLNGFVLGLKGTGPSEEDKAEAFVKGLKTGRQKKKTVKEEDGQSLSD